MSKTYTQKKDEKIPRAPGEPGAGRRHFNTETELAEATECPAGEERQEVLAGTDPDYSWDWAGLQADGTTCAGPSCPKWHSIITERDPKTDAPNRAEVVCTLSNRTNAMGILERRTSNP